MFQLAWLFKHSALKQSACLCKHFRQTTTNKLNFTSTRTKQKGGGIKETDSKRYRGERILTGWIRCNSTCIRKMMNKAIFSHFPHRFWFSFNLILALWCFKAYALWSRRTKMFCIGVNSFPIYLSVYFCMPGPNTNCFGELNLTACWGGKGKYSNHTAFFRNIWIVSIKKKWIF